MSSTRSDLTKENKKNKSRKFTFIPSSTSLSSGAGGFCSANQCSASVPSQQVYFTKSSFFSLPRTQPLQYFNTSNIEFKDDNTLTDTTVEITYSSLLTGYFGSMAVTLTTDILSDHLDFVPSSARYWVTQAPRAAFMYAMNASLGKIVVAPVANYMLINLCGVEKSKANLLTAVGSVALDIVTSPTSFFLAGLASGVLGGLTAKGIRNINLSSHFFSSQKNISTGEINWKSYSDDLFEQAKNVGQLVLISVKMTKCNPCKAMESSYNDAKVSDLVKSHYIPVKIDLAADKELVDSLTVESAPTTVIIDCNHNIIKKITGVHSGEELFKLLNELPHSIGKHKNVVGPFALNPT